MVREVTEMGRRAGNRESHSSSRSPYAAIRLLSPDQQLLTHSDG
jgi:hypothetical protein